MEGYFWRSGDLKVSWEALAKSRRGQVTSLHGTRSGQLIVYRIGNLMSGQPSCSNAIRKAILSYRIKRLYLVRRHRKISIDASLLACLCGCP